MSNSLFKQNNLRKIILLCIVGNALEWYDFAVFSFFAALISQVFFPSGHKFLGLLATFVIFASGFLVRPIGAILLGYYGDKYGRKKSLALSITLMTIATVAIGLIPSYATIGFMAPIALLFFRLLQGFSVGAEYSGAITYLTETSAPKNRMLNTSFSLMATVLGSLIGSFICTLTSIKFSEQQLFSYAWRIPFLAGFPLGYLGYYLRKKADETPEFLQLLKNRAVLRNPFLTVLKSKRKELVLTFFLFAPGNLMIYLFVVYFPAKLYHLHVMTLLTLLYINTFNLILQVILIPIIGHFGDRFGATKIIKFGFILLLLLTFPVFYLASHNQVLDFFMAQMLASMIYASLVSCIPGYVAAIFDTPVRFSGISTGLNLSASLFGGTAPMIGLLLEKLPYGFIWLGCYLFGVGVLGFSRLLCFLSNTR